MTDAKLIALSKRINAAMDRIDEERDSLRDIYVEAKGQGYIPKMLRKAIARQRMDASKRAEEDSILDLYDHALGNLGAALQSIREGATWEEAAEKHGVKRATLARGAAVSKRREVIPETEVPAVPPGDGEAPDLRGAAGTPSPSIDESCGGVESRHAPDGVDGESPACSSPDETSLGTNGVAASKEAGVAPGPQDTDLTIPPFLRGSRQRVAA